MKKYALLTATTMLIATTQPAMATTEASGHFYKFLQDYLLPLAMVMSVLTAITIFCSERFSSTQDGENPRSHKPATVLTCVSIALCSLPSLALEQFGIVNVVLLLINSALIAFGLTFRSN